MSKPHNISMDQYEIGIFVRMLLRITNKTIQAEIYRVTLLMKIVFAYAFVLESKHFVFEWEAMLNTINEGVNDKSKGYI